MPEIGEEFALSPDGRLIAYPLEATTGETRRLAEIEQAAYADLAWKPDP